MKNIFKICALVFLAAISTFAQGTAVNSEVRSTPGPVVPGASITICTAGATGTPCFPKATIYVDPLLTVVSANPVTADGNGNYNFYAPAGTYVRSITGQGLPGSTTTITIPCAPGSLTCGGSVILGLNNTFTGTNNFVGGFSINGLLGIAASGPLTVGDCTNILSINPPVIADSGGVCGGGGGGGAFGTLSTGTNTQAAMTVGTGASMAVSGSGTIAATSAPFSGLSGGTNTGAAMVVGTGASLSTTSTGVINANQVSGTTVPATSGPDQAFLTSATNVGLWTGIPTCLDAAGQHLNYNTSTHAFSCGTSGGTAGSAAFNTITAGTNASAAMVVGTGSSLAVSGSGTIAATSSPFAGVLSGTNTTSNMVLGTGSSLTVSGSGTNNATAVNGTTVPVNSAADQFLGTTASATGAWAAMPSCLDSGGNHINYNTSTHAFSCGTSGGTAGSAAFNTITPGTNTSAAMLVGSGSSLGTTGSGSITATALPFSGLTTASNTTATLTMGTGAVLTTSGTGQINANLVTGTTVPTNSAADQVLGTTASATGAWISLPSCLDSAGQHLNYNVSTHAFACGTTSSGGGGGAGTVIASPQFQLGYFPNAGSSATIQGSSILTDSTFKNLFIPGTTCISGPSPWVDITCPPYNARPVQINTTATGSGTSITVGSAAFQNNDYISIAAVGSLPTMTNPTGLTVTPMVSAGFSAQDTPSTPGLSGSSAYQYTIFPFDILGGANVPLVPVSITTGNATIGSFPPFTLSNESILNNVLTLVTTAPSGLPVNAMIHVTGTSNNHFFGGWYPISSISGSTITVNNVHQFCNPVCTGTGGQIVAFVGNVLKWVAATPSNSFNSTWEYGICAKRPSDSSLHLIGVTYPQSLNTPANANVVSIYNDYGAHFNTPVPWFLSDANCTAASPQRELYTGQVTAGGGSNTLTVTPSLPISATGQAARYDTTPLIAQAMASAGNQGMTYIPPAAGGALFPLNSVLNVPNKAAISQQGSLLANATIYTATVSWWGLNSSIGGGQFSQSLGPVIQCTANPCFYTGAAQQGDSNLQNITFNADHNTVIGLIDSAWGEKWYGNTFHFSGGATDYSGNCIMIRPQGAEYIFKDNECLAGPGQFQLDQTWAPGMYANGLCGGTNTCPNTGSVGTIYINNYTQTDRGFLNETNAGSGTDVKVDVGYSQGSLTPNFAFQNIQGNVNSAFEIDHFNHDTEFQAVFAYICGIGCASAFNGASAISPKIGHVNGLSADNGTVPMQITGGGNARTLADLAVFAQNGGDQSVPGSFVLGRGLYLSEGRGFLYGGVLTSDPQLGVSDFQPNVATPELSLENNGFTANIVPGTLGANITLTTPTTSGTLCTTTTCGGGGGGGLADPGGNGLVNRTALNTTAPITTSAGLAAVISDETGSGAAVFGTSPALVTPNVTTILDANANPFIKSSATGSAVDSVTITNAATANPATVIVGASGSDTNINLEFTSKGSGTVLLGSASAYVDSSGNAFFNSWNFSTPGPITMIGPESSGCTGQANQDAIFIGDSTKHAVQINNNNAGCESALALSGSPVATGNIVVGNSAFPDVTDSGIAASSVFTTSTAAAKFLGPSPWIDVTNPTYGAVGNGSTDDGPAINAAITVCTPGGAVFFPPGKTYQIATQIAANKAGCTLLGFDRSAIIRRGSDSIGPLINVTANNFVITGLTIDGNSANFSTGTTSHVNIQAFNVNYTRIYNNTIQNAGCVTTCTGTAYYNILLLGTLGPYVADNTIYGSNGATGSSAGDGVDIQTSAANDASQFTISRNLIDLSGNTGTSHTEKAIHAYVPNAGFTFHDGKVTDNILITPSASVAGASTVMCLEMGSGGAGNDPYNVIISKNTCRVVDATSNAQVMGFSIVTGSFTVTDNTVWLLPSAAGGYASGIGIELANDFNTIATGNKVDAGTATSTISGVTRCYSLNTVAFSVFNGNYCNGFTTSGIGLFSAGAGNTGEAISAASEATNTVTITSLTTNQFWMKPTAWVWINGITGGGTCTPYNGLYQVATVPTTLTFTVNNPTTGLSGACTFTNATYGPPVSNNVISNNTVVLGPTATAGNTAVGIQVSCATVVNASCSNNIIKGNNLYGSGSGSSQYGVEVQCSTCGAVDSNTIEGNVLHNWTVGIILTAGVTNTTVGVNEFVNTTTPLTNNGTATYMAPGALVPSAVPTCTFTSGGGTVPSCALDTGSTNDRGIIIATTGTGSPGSTGTITLTFGANFGINKPVCQYSANDNVTAWANGPVFKDKTPAIGSDLFTWTNIASGTPGTLTASSAYWINYQCVAK